MKKILASIITLSAALCTSTANASTSPCYVLKAEGVAHSIDGNYVLHINDHYFQDGVGETSIRCVIADNGDGTITLSATDYFFTDVEATFDQSTNTVTFTSKELGEATVNDKPFYIKFEPGYYDAATKKTVAADFSVTFNPEDGTIEFPENHSFGWQAYTSSAYRSSIGAVRLFDVLKLEPYVPIDEEQPGEWNFVGYATLEDAWVTAALTKDGDYVDPAEYPFDVELHQNVANPNLYRLWAPYHADGFALKDMNKSELKGQIQFDLTDPEHVQFLPGIAAGVDIGQGEMYMFDILGWQIWMLGDRYTDALFPQIIDFMEANNQPFSTFEDGILTVNLSVFDIDAACTHGYSWPNTQYKTSIIYFPEGAAIDSVDCHYDSEVIYYNIQGVRVNNPEKGLFIRVENGKATKILK